jgi:hypothetical protein
MACLIDLPLTLKRTIMPQLALPSLTVFEMYLKVRVEVWCWTLTAESYVASLQTSKLEIPR